VGTGFSQQITRKQRLLESDAILFYRIRLQVTDMGQPRLLRCRPGAAALEIWAENAPFNAATRKGGLDGLAFGGDGALYIADDVGGRIWRVTYHGDHTAPLVTAAEAALAPTTGAVALAAALPARFSAGGPMLAKGDADPGKGNIRNVAAYVWMLGHHG